MTKRRAVLLVIIAGILAVFFLLARQRNEVWRDSLTLWQDAAMKSPDKARPLNNLGLEYRRRGDIENAIKYFSMASAAPNDNVGARQMARANLAWMHFGAGQLQTAISIVNAGLIEHPSLEALNMLAVFALADGNPLESLRLTDDILRINPNWRVNPSLHLTRGQAFQSLGKCPEATLEYLFAQELKPGLPVPSCAIEWR